ncbi:hypothetical protein H4S02_010449 [Coemansia sp. RSA 2611]|nr:hypothetical protein H4S02_010449 [Coemansia sp. RSA 2611]
MGAVESLQSSSFHEFRLFSGRNTASADSIVGYSAGKSLKSATVCLSDYDAESLALEHEGKYRLCALSREKANERQSASMPHLPSVIEKMHQEAARSPAEEPVKDEPEAEKYRRTFTVAGLQQRLSRRLSRSKRARRHRRYSSGSVDQQGTRIPTSDGDQAQQEQKEQHGNRRPKSLPNLRTASAGHDLGGELSRELSWLSIDEPTGGEDAGTLAELPMIEAAELEWGSGSTVTLASGKDDADEAVADYMYLTACDENRVEAEARRWWPRRMLARNMQYMPKLSPGFLWAGDYWDVLSRCPMRPTSSLALASLREMASAPEGVETPRQPARAKPKTKRVLSEPMQYILYNSYLRYYGEHGKASTV